MAVMKVKLENILCFNDFEADFSYPKKLVNSPLEYEYLRDYPNMRYKKVNIIVGSNASGKTCLGRALWSVFRFLYTKETEKLREIVSDDTKDAYVLLDCVLPIGYFFRIELQIKTNGDILARHNPITISKNDSYESVVKRVDETKPFNNYIDELQKVFSGGWNFLFPMVETGEDKIYCKYDGIKANEFTSIYENVLKAFDPSIKNVTKSKEEKDSYLINFYHGKPVRVTHGESLTNLRRLSSGTKFAVSVAGLLLSIKRHENGFYYVDEHFSFVNSEIEIACLSKIIDLLGDGEQLFFTTHNKSLLAMPLPNHAFNFLKKEVNGKGEAHIRLINVSDFEKRNNVNPLNLYENDYFDVFPDTDKIFQI